MPRNTDRRQNAPATPPRNLREYTFLNHSLTVAEEAELDAMDVKNEFPMDRMYVLVEQGYSVKLSLDAKNQTFRCSVTDTDQDSGTYNICLTGYGESPDEAWCALAYRFFHLGQGSLEYFMHLPVRSRRR